MKALFETLVGPPADLPSGGLARFRNRPAISRRAVQRFLTTLLLLCVAIPARAQLIVGTIRSQDTERTVPGARIIASDSLGKTLIETITDQTGHFRMKLPGNVPFLIVVKKVGWRPSSSELIRSAPDDTLEIDLVVPAEPSEMEAVTVTAKGEGTANARSLAEAQRRGWKTIMPQEVDARRETSANFQDLLRSTAGSSVLIPTRADDCVKSNRTRRCLTYVVDGVPAGQSIYLNPRDIYFFSILSATESAVIWGDRAPWGAIVIVTRAYGDKKNP